MCDSGGVGRLVDSIDSEVTGNSEGAALGALLGIAGVENQSKSK